MINSVIDLSHWNTVASLKALEAKGMPHLAIMATLNFQGILGVIHKATQGLSYEDPRYHEREEPAIAAGLLWGAYHFGVRGDGYDQARFFMDTINYPDANSKETILLALDWEHSVGDSGDMSLIEAENWVSSVHDETGRWPVLYSGQAFLTEHISGQEDTLLRMCPLWIARYSRTQLPVVPKPWDHYSLWQYTDGEHGQAPHTVEGIGPCDRSWFNGDETELRAFWSGTK